MARGDDLAGEVAGEVAFRASERDQLRRHALATLANPKAGRGERKAARARLNGRDEVNLGELGDAALEFLEYVLALGKSEKPEPAIVARHARAVADELVGPPPAAPCARCAERDAAEATLTDAQRRAIALVAAGRVELDPATLPPG